MDGISVRTVNLDDLEASFERALRSFAELVYDAVDLG
jgi:hypothetical protein